VHAFVSRALEPTPVHVEAIVTSVARADGTSAHAYSLGVVERQILDALEMRLGVRGQAMPDMLEERRNVAASLGPAAEQRPISFSCRSTESGGSSDNLCPVSRLAGGA
jgi:hypothetical protein